MDALSALKMNRCGKEDPKGRVLSRIRISSNYSKCCMGSDIRLPIISTAVNAHLLTIRFYKSDAALCVRYLHIYLATISTCPCPQW